MVEGFIGFGDGERDGVAVDECDIGSLAVGEFDGEAETEARAGEVEFVGADFIEEALRVESPVQALSRLTVRSTTIDGVDIPAGSIVTVCLGGANRDPARPLPVRR